METLLNMCRLEQVQENGNIAEYVSTGTRTGKWIKNCRIFDYWNKYRKMETLLNMFLLEQGQENG